jgi:hypothetical protein
VPILLIDAYEAPLIDRTRLRHYTYDASGGRAFVALGCASLYNHSKEPNAEVEFDEAGQMLTVTALRTITMHEEIFIDYGEAADPGWA